MLGDTPTVDQVAPRLSVKSIVTRVTASVPAPMMRTRKSASVISSIRACHGPRSLPRARHRALTGPASSPFAPMLSLTDITRCSPRRTTTTASLTEMRRPIAFIRRSTVTR